MGSGIRIRQLKVTWHSRILDSRHTFSCVFYVYRVYIGQRLFCRFFRWSEWGFSSMQGHTSTRTKFKVKYLTMNCIVEKITFCFIGRFSSQNRKVVGSNHLRQNFKILRQVFYAIGQFFYFCKWPNNLAIWSHCPLTRKRTIQRLLMPCLSPFEYFNLT